jgi:AraC-like DNA-binding protein
VRLLIPDNAVQASATPELAHAIKQRLDQHLTNPIALPDLLADLDRRYEHLCRIFAATFGVPPLRYLTAARIERAKLLLREPAAQVAIIAQHLGYSDAAYFSRLFRAQVGVSPAVFRRSLAITP